MFDGLYKITSNLLIENKRQEIFARNMAGATSIGFKGEILLQKSFSEQLDQSISRWEPTGHNVIADQIKTDFSNGTITQSARSLDFALSGPGMFTVKTPSGNELYTRNGSFMASPDGILITREGHIVQGKEGQIEMGLDVDVNSLYVERGILKIIADGKLRELGELDITGIDDDHKLVRMSSNYFALKSNEQRHLYKIESPALSNYTLETSNVSTIQQMIDMVQSMRAFEAAQKVLKSQDEIIGQHLRMGRK
ncbi:MAG: flagellar hook basal-body protein [Lentisphaeria bacterium]|nr:flagellar hook basal-body protein [Lentisphaeria bacterium]NQZ70021.1 flagellar hook basal-body protein [Lentisphaeria bacterium]